MKTNFILNLFGVKKNKKVDDSEMGEIATADRVFANGAFTDDDALGFNELNPLLARQLSELEMQIGSLAQTQFEMVEERNQMRHEMDALKKILQQTQFTPNAEPPNKKGEPKLDNEAS